jgi:transposase
MVMRRTPAMTDFIRLTEAQMRKIEPYFPSSHGAPRVDDRAAKVPEEAVAAGLWEVYG